MLRKAFSLAKELGLSDEGRIDLATMLLPVPVTSWRGLDDEEVGRLLDAMMGYVFCRELLDHHRGVDGLDGRSAEL